MSWTTPRTWGTSELVTASLLNTHVRDNLAYLKASPTFDGTITVSGLGTHAFTAGGTGGNMIVIRNTTAGTGNFASIEIGNDAAAGQADIAMFSTTYTTSTYNEADSLRIYSAGAGGINLAAGHASGTIDFYTGGSTLRWTVNASGHLIPNGGDTYNIGDATNVVKTLYIGGSGGATGLRFAGSFTGTTTPTLGSVGPMGTTTPKWVKCSLQGDSVTYYLPIWT
jgi:hypothetical protein